MVKPLHNVLKMSRSDFSHHFFEKDFLFAGDFILHYGKDNPFVMEAVLTIEKEGRLSLPISRQLALL